MRISNKAVLFGTLISLVSGAAFADPSYWTADKLKSAKPLPQPKANFYPSGQQSVMEINSATAGVSQPGHSPSVIVTPDFNNKLFTPDAVTASSAMKVTPESVGGYKAYFSSSRVTPASATHTSPYSQTGKLFFSDGIYNYICSASVIRARLIITAGHCLYDAVNKRWYKNFLFVPGYYNGTAPLGSWKGGSAWVTTAWANGGGAVPNSGDFALLEIKDQVINNVTQRIGEVTGWYGYHTLALWPNHLTMLGYPVAFDGGNWMHRVDAQSYQSYYNNTVIYGSDMTAGSSGGPWIENFGQTSTGQITTPSGADYVVAVTSYGPSDTSLRYQGATMLDSQFINTSRTGILDKACAYKAGNC